MWQSLALDVTFPHRVADDPPTSSRLRLVVRQVLRNRKAYEQMCGTPNRCGVVPWADRSSASSLCSRSGGSPRVDTEEGVAMPTSTPKRGAKVERENVNLSEKYEVDFAKKRKTPSKNHPGMTPTTGAKRTRPKSRG